MSAPATVQALPAGVAGTQKEALRVARAACLRRLAPATMAPPTRMGVMEMFVAEIMEILVGSTFEPYIDTQGAARFIEAIAPLRIFLWDFARADVLSEDDRRLFGIAINIELDEWPHLAVARETGPEGFEIASRLRQERLAVAKAAANGSSAGKVVGKDRKHGGRPREVMPIDGDILKDLRLSRSLGLTENLDDDDSSVVAFSTAIGVSPDRIRRAERGQATPRTMDAYAKYAKKIGQSSKLKSVIAKSNPVQPQKH